MRVKFISLFAVTLGLLFYYVGEVRAQSSVRPPSTAIENKIKGNQVPGTIRNGIPDGDTWRSIRKGVAGSVSIPDKKAAILIQSDGEKFRLIRSGPLLRNLALLIAITLVALAGFYAYRGQIKVESGLSGRTIKRFSTIERMGHWLMAVSFIILAITGLNVTFGKEIIMPLIGKGLFGPLAGFLKYTHNYVAFSFMLGLAISFICWVAHNIPNKTDINWIAKAGGLLSKNSHPPADKFNAGQKLIFWGVMLGGLSLCFSGWALLFPFEYSFFTSTFNALSSIGIDVSTWFGLAKPPLTAIQEQQYNTIWHLIVAVLMVCMILAHIYIGSIGMEGAFDAMGRGDVDENWAKEHHSIWVEKVKQQEASPSPDETQVQPAE